MEDLYGGNDIRNIPMYSIGQAAHYLRIPISTVSSWIKGYRYSVKKGSKTFQPLINIPQSKPYLLSFTNLVEVHVLRAIRKDHQIQLNKVRQALDYIDTYFSVPHPLATQQFKTDGVDLFIEKYESLINISSGGQLTLFKEALLTHLERIVLDDSGLAIKLFPFTRSQEANNPRLIVIDPRLAFGRLVIAETGIPTDILRERYCAGDSISQLAFDYNCDINSIEEAIRCEIRMAA